MKVSVQNSIVKIDRALDKEVKLVNKLLTFIGTPGFVNVGGRIKPTPAPKFRLFNINDMSFPIGMLNYVKDGFKEAEYSFIVQDGRTAPGHITDFDLCGSGLRDYQVEAVEAVLKNPVGVIKHATGAGKSRTAISIVQKVNCRWLFLVNSSTLMHQFADSYEKLTGLQAGMLGDGVVRKRGEGSNLTVATFQTINLKIENPAMLKILEQVQGVIVDECHGAASETYCNILQKCKNAYYRVGLSGTPFDRGDKAQVYILGQLGGILSEVTSVDLIKRGILASPKIKFLKCEQSGVVVSNWASAKKKLIVESDKRNLLISGLVRDHVDYPCLVFCDAVAHGKSLETRFQSEGIDCKFLSGQKKTSERQKTIQDLERGELDVIVCTSIFDSGIDIPSLRSIVFAGGGKSVIASIQRLGRVLRIDPHTKETNAIVFDILDQGNKWLEKHAKKRMKTLRDEGHRVEVVSPKWK